MADQDNYYYVYSGVLDRFLYGSTDLEKASDVSTILSSKVPCMVIKENWIEPKFHIDLKINPLMCRLSKDSRKSLDISRQQLGQFLITDKKIKVEKAAVLDYYGDFNLAELYRYTKLIHVVLTEIVEATKYIDFFDLPAKGNMERLNLIYNNDEFFQSTNQSRIDNWSEYYQDITELTNDLKKVLFISESFDEARHQIIDRFNQKGNNIVVRIFEQFILNNLPTDETT